MHLVHCQERNLKRNNVLDFVIERDARAGSPWRPRPDETRSCDRPSENLAIAADRAVNHCNLSQASSFFVHSRERTSELILWETVCRNARCRHAATTSSLRAVRAKNVLLTRSSECSTPSHPSTHAGRIAKDRYRKFGLNGLMAWRAPEIAIHSIFLVLSRAFLSCHSH